MYFFSLYIHVHVVPSVVKSLTVIALSANLLHVSWELPLSPNGVLTGYQVHTVNLINYTEFRFNRSRDQFEVEPSDGIGKYVIIGASLSEPHVVRSTAEISVVCLSAYVIVRPETICCSIRIRALIGRFVAHNTWYSLQTQDKDITDSEARRQEKLRRRGEGG